MLFGTICFLIGFIIWLPVAHLTRDFWEPVTSRSIIFGLLFGIILSGLSTATGIMFFKGRLDRRNRKVHAPFNENRRDLSDTAAFFFFFNFLFGSFPYLFFLIYNSYSFLCL